MWINPEFDEANRERKQEMCGTPEQEQIKRLLAELDAAKALLRDWSVTLAEGGTEMTIAHHKHGAKVISHGGETIAECLLWEIGKELLEAGE